VLLIYSQVYKYVEYDSMIIWWDVTQSRSCVHVVSKSGHFQMLKSAIITWS